MDDKIYKIYLIEDHVPKIECINNYFDSVNRLLSGEEFNPEIDYMDSHIVFKNKGFEQIKVIHIKPANQSGSYYDYIYGDKKDWVKQIKDILNKEEKRVFLIDLALNKQERIGFNKNQEIFRAKTAKRILDLLAQQENKEDIIIESILSRIDDDYKKVLDFMNGDNLEKIFNRITTVRGNLFSLSSDPYYAKAHISESFEYIFNMGG